MFQSIARYDVIRRIPNSVIQICMDGEIQFFQSVIRESDSFDFSDNGALNRADILITFLINQHKTKRKKKTFQLRS